MRDIGVRDIGQRVEGRVGAQVAGQVSGEVRGQLERLAGAGGWYVVRLPPGASPAAAGWDRRGFVPVTVTVGGTEWDTSLMPMGDGTSFLALPAAVRRAEDLDEGDQVSAVYRGRPDPRGTTPTPAPSTRRGRW
ncbi:DUF1905 domain-containing protein [Aquipuribacter hungaricus]|uniref:DUF1905 domain-containing protein n=1 Tax=Aquipuribacter hungaricus TaxID=545624 RepID=UPI003609356F